MTRTPHEPDRPDTPDETWESLGRFWTGESTPEESEEIRRRLAESPPDAALLEAIDQYVGRERMSPPVDVEAALARVRRRRDVTPNVDQEGEAAPTLRPRAPRWRLAGAPLAVPALAGAALAAAAVAAILFSRQRHDRPAVIETSGGGRVIVTGIGQRDSIRLPDGSRVLLAPATELSIAAVYGTARREVELHGEAQFHVVHDPGRPFVVRAGNLVIRDVGTTFNVHTLAPDSVVVSVSEGAVKLQSTTASGTVELQAGDVASTGPASGAVVHRGGASDLDVAWTRGRLMLRDAPLSTVVYELYRWYGIVLRVDDPVLVGRHYTATFDGSARADEVLTVIRTLWDATMERHGDTVIMRRAGSS